MKEQTLERFHVRAGRDHVHSDRDARVVGVAEAAQQVLRLRAGRLGCDLLAEVVALAELLLDDLDNVVGVAVLLGKDERLRNLGSTREDLAEEPVPEGVHNEPDLVRRHHVAVELIRRIREVVFHLGQGHFARAAVAPGDVAPGLYGTSLFGDLRLDPVDLVTDVDPVRDRLGVRVVLDDVVVEEADRLRARRGSQPDQERVEVLNDLTPDVVDGPVALVDNDEVEGLDGQVGRVFHRNGFLATQPARLEQGFLLVLRVVLRVPLQDGVEPLNGRDHDLAGRADRVALQPLDHELIGEAETRRGIPELLELVQRLLPEVVPVDQEQDAVRLRVLDQAVAGRDCRERLAAASRHLDEGTGPAVRERLFEVLDRLELHTPESALLKFR